MDFPRFLLPSGGGGLHATALQGNQHRVSTDHKKGKKAHFLESLGQGLKHCWLCCDMALVTHHPPMRVHPTRTHRFAGDPVESRRENLDKGGNNPPHDHFEVFIVCQFWYTDFRHTPKSKQSQNISRPEWMLWGNVHKNGLKNGRDQLTNILYQSISNP